MPKLWLLRERDLSGLRRLQQRRQQNDDNALDEAEPQERRPVAISVDGVDDRDDGCCCTCAEAAGGQARCKPPAVSKPLQRIADTGAIDAAGTDARYDRRDIEHGKRRREAVQSPADGDDHAANHDDLLRPEFVHEPAFDRDQPGLREYENAERHLNCG